MSDELDMEKIYEAMPLEGVPMDKRIKLLAKRYAREDMSAEQVAAFPMVTEEETKSGMTTDDMKEDRNAIARTAVMRGDMNVLEAIFEQEREANRKNKSFGRSIRSDYGPRLEGEKHKRGANAITLAIKQDNVAMVKKLLERDAEIQSTDDSEEGLEFTPMMFAVEIGNQEIVDLMLEAHKDQSKNTVILHTDRNGRSALHHAAIHGQTEAAKAIVKFCEEEQLNKIKNLIELKDDNGNTPADLAKENGHGDTAKAVGPQGGCCTVM